MHFLRNLSPFCSNFSRVKHCYSCICHFSFWRLQLFVASQPSDPGFFGSPKTTPLHSYIDATELPIKPQFYVIFAGSLSNSVFALKSIDTYKTLKCPSSTYLADFITLSKSNYLLRSSYSSHLIFPRSHFSRMDNRAFSMVAPKLWGELHYIYLRSLSF